MIFQNISVPHSGTRSQMWAITGCSTPTLDDPVCECQSRGRDLQDNRCSLGFLSKLWFNISQCQWILWSNHSFQYIWFPNLWRKSIFQCGNDADVPWSHGRFGWGGDSEWKASCEVLLWTPLASSKLSTRRVQMSGLPYGQSRVWAWVDDAASHHLENASVACSGQGEPSESGTKRACGHEFRQNLGYSKYSRAFKKQVSEWRWVILPFLFLEIGPQSFQSKWTPGAICFFHTDWIFHGSWWHMVTM